MGRLLEELSALHPLGYSLEKGSILEDGEPTNEVSLLLFRITSGMLRMWQRWTVFVQVRNLLIIAPMA